MELSHDLSLANLGTAIVEYRQKGSQHGASRELCSLRMSASSV